MNHCQTCTFWQPNRNGFKEGDPSICNKFHIVTVAELGCDFHLAQDSYLINVPQHTRNSIVNEPNPNPVGPVEILIVTHAKDFRWLEYCLRAIEKFCIGFQGVTVAHPSHQSDLFIPLIKRFGVRLFAYNEIAGKGMLHHMVKMAEADIIVPASTRYVMHLDADCIFHMATLPEHYFWDNKPVYLMRSWASLSKDDPSSPGSKVVSDCLQWKGPTDAQVGFDTPFYTMCRHPTVLPMDFYRQYRQHVENTQKKPFEVYMLSGRNEFPQDRMDWTAMGAFAHHAMRGSFYWLDIELNPAPKDRQTAFWSHGGCTPSVIEQIETFLK